MLYQNFLSFFGIFFALNKTRGRKKPDPRENHPLKTGELNDGKSL
jgi:hypothetical protein